MRGTLKSTKSMKELKRYNNKNMRNITVHVFFFSKSQTYEGGTVYTAIVQHFYM